MRLPQTLYAKGPDGRNYYFGRSDIRFEVMEQDENAELRDIATYGFLGCGEFYLQADGTFSNGRFAIPPSTFSLLRSVTDIEERKRYLLVWENLFHRKPEAVRDAVALRNLRAFTADGMYLGTRGGIPESLRDIPGLFIFKQPPKETFEELLGGRKISKPVRKLLLEALTRNNQYNESVWPWFRAISDSFTIDQVQRLMEVLDISLLEFENIFYGNIYVPAATRLFSGLGFRYLYGKITSKQNGNSPNDLMLLVSVFAQYQIQIGKQFKLGPEEGPEQRLDFFQYIKDQGLGFRSAMLLALTCNAGDAAQTFFEKQEDIPRRIQDDYEVRLPFTRAELKSWGYILRNCLKGGSYSPSQIWGIFQKGQLIGACQYDPNRKGAWRPVLQMSTFQNTSFPPVFENMFTAMIATAYSENEGKLQGVRSLETFPTVIRPEDVEEPGEPAP